MQKVLPSRASVLGSLASHVKYLYVSLPIGIAPMVVMAVVAMAAIAVAGDASAAPPDPCQ